MAAKVVLAAAIHDVPPEIRAAVSEVLTILRDACTNRGGVLSIIGTGSERT